MDHTLRQGDGNLLAQGGWHNGYHIACSPVGDYVDHAPIGYLEVGGCQSTDQFNGRGSRHGVGERQVGAESAGCDLIGVVIETVEWEPPGAVCATPQCPGWDRGTPAALTFSRLHHPEYTVRPGPRVAQHRVLPVLECLIVPLFSASWSASTATPSSSMAANCTAEAEVPADLDVHLIVDSYATYKAALVHNWLAKRPRFYLRFTPTSPSWLNLAERWFALQTEKQLRRGVYQSSGELEAAIYRHLDIANEHPKPFVWVKTADRILANVSRFCRRTLET